MKLENKVRFIRDVEYFGMDETIAEKYIETLKSHIKYVVEAGHKIGVSPEQLDIHDDSKWFETEFVGYALHFQGGGSPDKFSRSWLHHIHNNPHHWQYWLFADNYSPKNSNVENGAVEMPRYYALEMIADWMGASMAYTGSWDMTEWLANNMSKIRLHSRTAEYIASELDHLGYAGVVYKHNFDVRVNVGL